MKLLQSFLILLVFWANIFSRPMEPIRRTMVVQVHGINPNTMGLHRDDLVDSDESPWSCPEDFSAQIQRSNRLSKKKQARS